MNIEELKQALRYDEHSGDFVYLKKLANRIEMGDVAGYVDKSTGYRRVTVFGKKYYAHRLAHFYMTGRFPVGIDHIDGNKLNNRWSNLREADQGANNKNRSMNKNNTSGHTGVYWSTDRKKWIAFVNVNNRPVNLGGYTSIDDAISARNIANIEHGFHENHGRRP